MTLSSTATSASATLSFLLLLLLHAAMTTATLCMSCSWSGVEHPSKICAAEDISSLTADQKLWIHAINCGQQNCNVRRVISRSTGKGRGKLERMLRTNVFQILFCGKQGVVRVLTSQWGFTWGLRIAKKLIFFSSR